MGGLAGGDYGRNGNSHRQGDATVVLDGNTLLGGSGDDRLEIDLMALANRGNYGDTADDASITMTNTIMDGGDQDDAIALTLCTDSSAIAYAIDGNSFIGGNGTDTLDLSGVDRGVVVDLSAGTIAFDGVGSNLISGIEILIGTTAMDVISGSANADVLAGGLGADQLHGDLGADVFILNLGDGSDVIDDFSGSWGELDQIRLLGTAFANRQAVLGAATDVGGNVEIAIGGDTLTLLGVSTAQLSLNDFALA